MTNRRPGDLLAIAISLVLVGAPSARAAAGVRVSTSEAVQRAERYVEWYDSELPRLVAGERYEQRSSRDEGGKGASRVLESDVAWVPAAPLGDVLCVRDVHRVDGREVQASRIQRLLEAGVSTPALAREILTASAAYNLGPGLRNLNVPTFALVYLRGDRGGRLRWRSRPEPDGTLRLDFEERRRPAVVRDADGRAMRARGQLWIDAGSGRVLRSTVTLAGEPVTVHDGHEPPARRDVTYTLTVQFAPDDHLKMWLPSRMTERYEQRSRQRGRTTIEVVTGDARYTHYRRFETEGRVRP